MCFCCSARVVTLQGTLDEEIGVKQFCVRYVEVMGSESDHVHIVALSDALQVCRLPTSNVDRISQALAGDLQISGVPFVDSSRICIVKGAPR